MKACQKTVVFLLSLLLLLLPLFAEGAAEPGWEVNAQGMPRIPNFSLPSPENTEVSLTSFLGKPVVLNFWASWCPPCKAEMPAFQQFYEEYAFPEGDYALLSINLTDGVQETRESCQQYLKDNHYTFPVVYDETGAIFSMFSDGRLPVTAFIDEEGFIIGGAFGGITYEYLLASLGIEAKE